jgi:hypothetical protein
LPHSKASAIQVLFIQPRSSSYASNPLNTLLTLSAWSVVPLTVRARWLRKLSVNFHRRVVAPVVAVAAEAVVHRAEDRAEAVVVVRAAVAAAVVDLPPARPAPRRILLPVLSRPVRQSVEAGWEPIYQL